MKTTRQFLLLCGLLLACGCREGWEADYSTLGLVEISGKVTMDGAPLTEVTVLFECSDKTFSYGRTDAQGNYKLMFNSEKSGALPGPKTIRIKAGAVGEVAESEIIENPDGTMSKPTKNTLPPCYSSKSQLQANVKEGVAQILNFELKSDCSVRGPAN